MLKQFSVILLLVIPLAAMAKDKNKITPLPESAVAALNGKSVTITRHDKASFTAFTAGKAAFALLGAGAMIAAGNQIVKENEIADPADVLERELAAAIIKQYGLQLKAGSSPVIKASKPKDIAATQSDVDYILDLQSTGWMFAYIPTDWDSYWIGYSTRAQLINRVSGKALAVGTCYSDTQKHPFAAEQGFDAREQGPAAQGCDRVARLALRAGVRERAVPACRWRAGCDAARTGGPAGGLCPGKRKIERASREVDRNGERPPYQSHIVPSSRRATGSCLGLYGYFAASFSSMVTPWPGVSPQYRRPSRNV